MTVFQNFGDGMAPLPPGYAYHTSYIKCKFLITQLCTFMKFGIFDLATGEIISTNHNLSLKRYLGAMLIAF